VATSFLASKHRSLLQQQNVIRPTPLLSTPLTYHHKKISVGK